MVLVRRAVLDIEDCVDRAGPGERRTVRFFKRPSQVIGQLLWCCDLRCAFCIAGANAFDPTRGKDLEPESFAAANNWGQAQGARNIQWVGGEPTMHSPAILQVMSQCSSLPPVVWKSDFNGTAEAMSLLKGLVDVYIADFKFGNDDCVRELAGVGNYLAIVTRNLKAAAEDSRLIVGRLILPGHLTCCFEPVARWMSEHLPEVWPNVGSHGFRTGDSVSLVRCFACVLGVCDPAGPVRPSRSRIGRSGLPRDISASASRTIRITGLNTRPARTPANASTTPLRRYPHDSGPVWLAMPPPYETLIHITSPALAGAQCCVFDNSPERPCLECGGLQQGRGEPDTRPAFPSHTFALVPRFLLHPF